MLMIERAGLRSLTSFFYFSNIPASFIKGIVNMRQNTYISRWPSSHTYGGVQLRGALTFNLIKWPQKRWWIYWFNNACTECQCDMLRSYFIRHLKAKQKKWILLQPLKYLILVFSVLSHLVASLFTLDLISICRLSSSNNTPAVRLSVRPFLTAFSLINVCTLQFSSYSVSELLSYKNTPWLFILLFCQPRFPSQSLHQSVSHVRLFKSLSQCEMLSQYTPSYSMLFNSWKIFLDFHCFSVKFLKLKFLFF